MTMTNQRLRYPQIAPDPFRSEVGAYQPKRREAAR